MPKNRAMEFAVDAPLRPHQKFTWEQLFGDSKFTFRRALFMRQFQKLVQAGSIDEAGVWQIHITSERFFWYRTRLYKMD